ncbi:conserved hypothetical protein [Neospora caninum Liverpool]|nr:conserved hypothetical protein [Neospora caninum Liverpool]CBZ52089.1 conserved hypothetical protein [Neospora caninum Liverpool]|eukprot:XP_003882121.1 conserved hypothetical protein [Neospora caninum Liverpool]
MPAENKAAGKGVSAEERHREQGRTLLALLKRQGDRKAQDHVSTSFSSSLPCPLSSSLPSLSSLPSSSPFLRCASASSAGQSPQELPGWCNGARERREEEPGMATSEYAGLGRCRWGHKAVENQHEGKAVSFLRKRTDGSSSRVVQRNKVDGRSRLPHVSPPSVAFPATVPDARIGSKEQRESEVRPLHASIEKPKEASFGALHVETSPANLTSHHCDNASSLSSSAFSLSPFGFTKKETFALPAFMRSPDPSEVRVPCAFLRCVGKETEASGVGERRAGMEANKRTTSRQNVIYALA